MNNLKAYSEKLLQQMQHSLDQLESSGLRPYACVEACIKVCGEVINQLRALVAREPFADPASEIYFFRSVKPVAVARYLFYRRRFRALMDTCCLNKELQVAYYQDQLKQIQQFITNNQFYYTYYLTGDTSHDQLYFLRAHHDWKLCQDNHYPAEPGFSTNMDGMLALIIANEHWLAYVQQQINGYDGGTAASGCLANEDRLNWTGPASALIESIYSWYARGWCGQDTIRKIMKGMSWLFKKDLGDYYKVLQHIDNRKINQTKALDQMKSALLNYLQQRRDKD